MECSICGDGLDPEGGPHLRTFDKESGTEGIYCDHCADLYFGVKFYREDYELPLDDF